MKEGGMRKQSSSAVIMLVIVLFTSLGALTTRTAGQRPLQPTLPLPEVTPETNQLPEQPLWNSVRAWHYNPKMVRPLWDVWAAFEDPPLSMRMKVMVAAVTDSRNHCPYCLSSAVCYLEKDGLSEKQILALQTDIAGSDFSDKEKALLLLSERMTVDPSSAYTQVGPALSAGWTEAEVSQAIFVAAYFNMLNRISEAFAFPPDEDHPFDPSPEFPILKCGPS
jgi:alkylhydroperoxidase family enzyme